MADKLLKTEEMRTKSIPKLIIKYSLSTFAALFFNELYNIVDTVFVSRGVGDNAMGGVSIIFPFILIQSAVSQTIGSGAATIVSKHLGRNDFEKAGNTTANAMIAFYSVSIIITILGLIFIKPLLRLFGATDDIMPFAKEYFTIILLGNVFSTGFSSIIRAEGKMVYSLLIWLIPTAVNVSLDAVFIYGLHMGVKGAALATVICYFTSFLMWVIFINKLSVQKLKKPEIDFKIIKSIIALGIPMLLQLGSISILFAFINKVLSLNGGTLGINTFAYVSKILSFAIVPFNAVATAISPIISYNHGAMAIKRINKTFNSSIIICEAYAVLGLIFAFALSGSILKIFTDDAQIINQGTQALKALSFAMPFLPVTLISGTYFQAMEQKTNAIISNSLLLIFALVSIIIFTAVWGIQTIYFSISAACILSCTVSVIIKAKGRKQL